MSQKLVSWNVNGIRACIKKGFVEKVYEMDPDIICLQETKAQDDQVKEALSSLKGYEIYTNSAVKKGYSGTAILTKKTPLSVMPDIGIEEHDQEGRVITAEYDHYYFVGVYVPNSGQELVRLDYRSQWDVDFLAYLKELEKTKPVILCGDLNVAHQPIDLARPKSNYNKTSGYTQREIDGLTSFIESGLVDTYRYFYPDVENAYSWWSYRFQAKAKNIGWRIDYFLTSRAIIEQIEDSFILPEIEGSDHCPVGIIIK